MFLAGKLFKTRDAKIILMKKIIFLSLILTILSPVLAQDVIIDSFESLDPTYFGVYIESSLTLTSFSISGKALNMTLGQYDEGYLVRNNLGIELPNPLNYYNLSFWYYRMSDNPDCNGEGYTEFGMNAYLGELEAANPDGQWIVIIFTVDGLESREGIKSCNGWHRFNWALDDCDGYAGDVNLSNSHLGSFAIEIFGNPDTTVLFDELRLIPKVQSCVENWQCDAWSTCTAGIQTRTCTDLNTCGTTYDKPVESQICTYSTTPSCTPDWACYDWGDCINNIQSRTCYDSNNCNTLSGQPQTSRSCVTPKLTILAHVNSSFERKI
jgi:hypothetical protein